MLWYVSNVSIIFDCSMLYYLLFWMFMGFIIHFYIIFGTNQLTQSPAPVSVFYPVLGFRRKGKSNGVQLTWNFTELIFGKKQAQKTWSVRRGIGEEVTRQGACPPPRRAPHPREHLLYLLTWGPSPSGGFPSKNNFSSWFRSVLTPSDIPFPRNTEIGIKQQIWVGPPVNRLVPKII